MLSKLQISLNCLISLSLCREESEYRIDRGRILARVYEARFREEVGVLFGAFLTSTLRSFSARSTTGSKQIGSAGRSATPSPSFFQQRPLGFTHLVEGG